MIQDGMDEDGWGNETARVGFGKGRSLEGGFVRKWKVSKWGRGVRAAAQ